MIICVYGNARTRAYEQTKALQYLFEDGAHRGRELREKINTDLLTATDVRQAITRLKLAWLLTMSRPAFYQMMSGLEKSDAVEGWNEIEMIEDVPINSRWYRIKGVGLEMLDEFEEDLIPDFKIQLGWAGI